MSPTDASRTLAELGVRRKMAVGRTDDAAEVEADRVADEVVRRSKDDAAPAPEVTETADDAVRRQSEIHANDHDLGGRLHLTEEGRARSIEEEEAASDVVRRRAVEASAETGGLREAAARAVDERGSGDPLDPTVKEALEASLDRDLSEVRVHRGPAADRANRDLRAKAFAYRNHVWLGPGQSPTDLRLMAHEVAHVVQSGAARKRTSRETNPSAITSGAPDVVRRSPATAAPPPPASQEASERPTGASVELKGQKTLSLSPEAAKRIDDEGGSGELSAKFGQLASGTVKVTRMGEGFQLARGSHSLALRHPLLIGLGDGALSPYLVVSDSKGAVEGHVQLGNSKKSSRTEVVKRVLEHPGIAPFAPKKSVKLVNELKDGHLKLGFEDVGFKFGTVLDGTLTLFADNELVRGAGSFGVQAKGVANGSFDVTRKEDGRFAGSGQIDLTLPKNFSGKLDAKWDGAQFEGSAEVGYAGEKLNGKVKLTVLPEGRAQQREAAARAAKGPAGGDAKESAAEAPAAAQAPAKSNKKEKYVVFGEGDLAFAFNDWLSGTAYVLVASSGHVTVVGEITPEKEIELFPQKPFTKELPKLEMRAIYGIPVVGNLYIRGSLQPGLFAHIGPGRFHKIKVRGTYSTDPKELNNFSIQGTFNVSAAAGFSLRGEIAAGIRIAKHDLEAGGGITAMAGVKAYAEATPIIGYREKTTDEAPDKKGEFFLRGELDLAARAFLGLKGDLFVRVDAPWWSPVPDKTWTWPLGSLEYPLGSDIGLRADVDYVFGSNQPPNLELKPPKFSADKFLSDLTKKQVPKGSGKKDKPKAGQWKEKNTAQDAAPGGKAQGQGKDGLKPGEAAAVGTPPKKKASGATGKKEKDQLADGRSAAQAEREAMRKLNIPERPYTSTDPFEMDDAPHVLSLGGADGLTVMMASAKRAELKEKLNRSIRNAKGNDGLVEALKVVRSVLAERQKAVRKADEELRALRRGDRTAFKDLGKKQREKLLKAAAKLNAAIRKVLLLGDFLEKLGDDFDISDFSADEVRTAIDKQKQSRKVHEVVVDAGLYPESAYHIKHAKARGHGGNLTIDRTGGTKNRRASLKGEETSTGQDRDEFPPAMFVEGGTGASIMLIDSSDNRGSGSSFGNQLSDVADGAKVKFTIKSPGKARKPASS